MICHRPDRPLLGTTVSPRVTVHSSAFNVAFSNGSPIISPSRLANAWQVNRTCFTGDCTSIFDNATGSSELQSIN
jgi:hypothetical protein